jgi:hypothetical protein
MTWYLGAEIVNATLRILGLVGGLVFALNFPRELRAGWREGRQRAIPLLFVLLSAVGVLIVTRIGVGSTELLNHFKFALESRSTSWCCSRFWRCPGDGAAKPTA